MTETQATLFLQPANQPLHHIPIPIEQPVKNRGDRPPRSSDFFGITSQIFAPRATRQSTGLGKYDRDTTPPVRQPMPPAHQSVLLPSSPRAAQASAIHKPDHPRQPPPQDALRCHTQWAPCQRTRLATGLTHDQQALRGSLFSPPCRSPRHSYHGPLHMPGLDSHLTSFDPQGPQPIEDPSPQSAFSPFPKGVISRLPRAKLTRQIRQAAPVRSIHKMALSVTHPQFLLGSMRGQRLNVL